MDLGVWDRFEDIPFEKLPDRFVLKATHGSHYIYLCKDKSSLDIGKLKKIVNGWLREDFSQKFREIQYRDIPPRVIAEQYFEDDTGELTDYKIHCIGGRPQFIELVQYRNSHMTDDILDLDWNLLPITCVGYPYSGDKFNTPKPAKLAELLTVAQKLAADFPLVRVDLYLVGDHIYFGELTFTPGGGFEAFAPPSAERHFGDLVDLSQYRSRL